MDVKSEQELVAAIHLQQLAREAALLKRAKAGSSLSSGWYNGVAVLAAGLLAGGSGNPWKAAAIAGIFSLMFVVASLAHARVNALVELLELRGNSASTPDNVRGRAS